MGFNLASAPAAFGMAFGSNIPFLFHSFRYPGRALSEYFKYIFLCRRAAGDDILGRFRHDGRNPGTAGVLQHDVA